MADEKQKNWVRALSEAINMATTIAAAVAICVFVGWKLDDKFGTSPTFTVIGVFLGMATAFKVMWDRVNKNK